MFKACITVKETCLITFLYLKFKEIKTNHALKLNQQTEVDKQITFFEHTSN
jgi:hypothetical protein